MFRMEGVYLQKVAKASWHESATEVLYMVFFLAVIVISCIVAFRVKGALS